MEALTNKYFVAPQRCRSELLLALTLFLRLHSHSHGICEETDETTLSGQACSCTFR